MSDKERLCKLVKKDVLKKDFKEFARLVKNPTHICENCGRASNDKKHLCEPREI